MGRLNLIFDADDTLWECTVLFERAVEGFIRYLDHPALSREEVRAELNECERATIAAHGYGAGPFERSLGDCLARVRPDIPVSEADRAALRRLCAPIRESEIELLEDVPETLRALGGRHRLFLLTKGDLGDQRRKIDASGLAEMFHGVEIVPEKDPAAYRAFAADRRLHPDDTWMIGNSPRSDIWPALETGMGAVLVPHPMTWTLEQADLPEPHHRFHALSPFGRLTEFF